MNLAIGIFAKRKHRDLGDKSLNKFSDVSYVTDLEISHFCYSGDDRRNEKGFKFEQDYFLNGSDIKAITKRFEEVEFINEKGLIDIHLNIFFDYYEWPRTEINSTEIIQEVVLTKNKQKKFKAKSKQLTNRRINQRRRSIDDLKSLGVRFESLTPVFPHLAGYEERMKRIFSRFQLEIGRFEDTNSSDFKNAILIELQGDNIQLLEDLNTLVPSGENTTEGLPIMIETWKGIMARL